MRKTTFSLSRNRILRKTSQFKRIYNKGKRISGGRITIYYRKSSDSGKIAGFSTVKRMKKAVCRNRARRLMKEFFRLHQEEIRNGMEYVFVWKGAVESCCYQEIESEIIELLREADLLNR